MSFMDEIVTNNSKVEGIDTKAGETGFGQGLDLAMKRRQLDIHNVELGLKRQDLESKMDERELDYLRHISNKDTVPSARKGLIQAYAELRKTRGKETRPEILDMFSQDEGIGEAFNTAYAAAANPNNPVAQEAAKNQLKVFTQALGGDRLKAVQTLEEAKKFPDQLQKLQAIVSGKIQQEALSTKNGSYQESDLPALTDFLVSSGLTPGQASTRALALIRQSSLKQEKSEAEVANLKAGIPLKEAQTQAALGRVQDLARKNIRLTDPAQVAAYLGQPKPDGTMPSDQEHAQAQIENAKILAQEAKTKAQDTHDLAKANIHYKEQVVPLMLQRMSVQERRLKLQNQKFDEQLTKDVLNAPEVILSAKQSILAGDAMGIVDRFKKTGTLKRQDLILINKEASRLLTGGAVSSVATEMGLDTKTLIQDITKIGSYLSGDNLSDVGKGVALDALDRFQRIVYRMNLQRKNAVEGRVASQINNGTLPSTQGQLLLWTDAHTYGYRPEVLDPSVPEPIHLVGKGPKIQASPEVYSNPAPAFPKHPILPPGGAQTKITDPKEIEEERKKANNMIKKIRDGKGNGVTEEMVRRKFNKKTEKDL